MEFVSTDYLRFVVALVVVLGLIAVLACLAKRFRIGALSGMATGSGRLKVIESLAIDARQRLVIVRRDDQEHLLLIGPDAGQLLEADIKKHEHRSSEHKTSNIGTGQ